MRTAAGRSGFTLTEALVVLAILAIVSALALPRIGQALLDRQQKDAAVATAALIRTGQSLAQSLSTPVRVSISPGQAVLEVLEGTTWRRHQTLTYPPRLSVTPVVLVFDGRGLLASPSAPYTFTIAGKSIRITRWGEVVLQ